MTTAEINEPTEQQIDFEELGLTPREIQVAAAIGNVAHCDWFQRREVDTNGIDFPSEAVRDRDFRMTTIKLVEAGLLVPKGERSLRKYMKVGEWAVGLAELDDAVKAAAETPEPVAPRTTTPQPVSRERLAVGRMTRKLEDLDTDQLAALVEEVDQADVRSIGDDTWYNFPTLVAPDKEVLSRAAFVVAPDGSKRFIEWDIMAARHVSAARHISGIEIALHDNVTTVRQAITFYEGRFSDEALLRRITGELDQRPWVGKNVRLDPKSVVERFRAAIRNQAKVYGDGRMVNIKAEVLVDPSE